ncbi:MAG: DNA/RNA nuclease SfsA [Gammaproteobacteria bacterium]
MNLDNELLPAILIKRYKRFLADVQLPSGETITLHCPNTGSMKNCQQPGSRVWYTDSGNPKRKYPCTWQIVEVDEKHLVGINTALANGLVAEAITQSTIRQLPPAETLKREVKYGEQGSRVDLYLEYANASNNDKCYVEVKNVSLGMSAGLGVFPDAVTSRGQKHLRELMLMREQGFRAVLFFCVQHTGIDRVEPADDIDPEYAALLREAASRGVEILAYRAQFELNDASIALVEEIPVQL